jgi:hypothetical protein
MCCMVHLYCMEFLTFRCMEYVFVCDYVSVCDLMYELCWTICGVVILRIYVFICLFLCYMLCFKVLHLCFQFYMIEVRIMCTSP